jgi:O-antigen/teichoic acid export membrane protein
MRNKVLTFFYSGVSTFSNLIASLVVFIILARVLDKSIFGDYVFYNSLAAIFCVLIDFGINQKLLREGRIDLPNLNILFLNNLLLKAYIFLSVFVLYFIVIIGILHYDLYSILIFLTVSSFSFFQLSTVIFRVIEDYRLESIITFTSSLIFILTCLGISYYTSDIIIICITLLSVRFCTFLATLLIIKKKIHFRFKRRSILFKKLIIESLPYLTDRIVSVLYSNVDTLIIKYYIGSVGVATYNSGLKLASGSLGVSTILSNIYLPKISVITYKSTSKELKINKVFRELWLLLAILGLFIVIVFTFFNTIISDLFFSNKFPELIFLLPLFGLFVSTRLLASYYGIILTAIGKQKERAKANMISFLTMVISGALFTHHFGLKGTLFSLVLTTSLLIIFYVFILKQIQFKFLYLKGVFGVLVLTTFIVWTRLS